MLDEGHAEHGAHLGIVTTTVAERAEAVSVTRTKIFATYDRGVAR